MNSPLSDLQSGEAMKLGQAIQAKLGWKAVGHKDGRHALDWYGERSKNKHELTELMTVYVNGLTINFKRAQLFVDQTIGGWHVYLRGELSTDEREILENLMETDPDWKKVKTEWDRDQQTLTKWPALRQIAGITGITTKRLGAKETADEVGGGSKRGKKLPKYTSWE